MNHRIVPSASGKLAQIYLGYNQGVIQYLFG